MKLIMLTIVLAFAVSLPTDVLAQQTEDEDEAFDICAFAPGYGHCEFRCRGEYEVCLHEADGNDENRCRGEFDNCARICRKAYCEE